MADLEEQLDLSREQERVLAEIKKGGSEVDTVRQRAKETCVERPLSVIKSLIELGFIELKNGLLVRIR